MYERSLFALTLASVLATPAPRAQWQTVKNRELGVSYQMPKKYLKAIPENAARPVPHQADRWASLKPVYGSGGAFSWQIRVLEFERKAAVTGTPEASKAKTPQEKAREEMLAKLRASTHFTSFDDWLARAPENKNASFKTKAKARKQRGGGRLAYRYWVWKKPSAGHVWIHKAACYDLDGRQVAIVGHIPDGFERKLGSTLDRACASLRLLAGGRSAAAKKRKVKGEQFVVVKGDPEFTKLRRKLLDKAVAPLEKLTDWDVFCTERYIVLYSFDSGKHARALAFARDLASKMDEMNKQYRKRFKPHKGVTKWWSVLRICRNKAEFDRYGGTSGSVIGWFNPSSKELVVFNAKKLGQFKTDVIAYHEGWHQYAHFWFPGASLHRWFDEGMGDWFSSMKRLGRNNWRIESSKMRKETIKALVRAGKTVPLREIVAWHKDKFYGRGAANYYAQGYAMVDFFIRGPKSPYWDKSWNRILDTYIKVSLETKDTDKAVEEAFRGVDWPKLEKAWQDYVKKAL